MNKNDEQPKHKFGHRIPQKCKVSGCNLNLRSHGYCRIHWGRFQRNGTTDKPIRERHDYVDKKGYIRRYVEGKRQGQYVHRLVMEEILGRGLLPGETVHHKNDINGDNEPKNLELWVTLHPKGSRVADLLEFAHLVIRRYRKNT